MALFELTATTYFKEQFEKLLPSEREKIQKRLQLLKENPFRNKSVHSPRFGRLFRIRLEIQRVENRIIYAILGQKVVVAGILDRRNDYRDLEKLLAKMDAELQ